MAKGENPKQIHYFFTMMGNSVGQDSPAEVKRKVDGYLAQGWEIIHTSLHDTGTGISVYHVFLE